MSGTDPLNSLVRVVVRRNCFRLARSRLRRPLRHCKRQANGGVRLPFILCACSGVNQIFHQFLAEHRASNGGKQQQRKQCVHRSIFEDVGRRVEVNCRKCARWHRRIADVTRILRWLRCRALALGIGINMTAFTSYEAIFTRSLDARGPGRIVNLSLIQQSGEPETTSAIRISGRPGKPPFPDWRDRTQHRSSHARSIRRLVPADAVCWEVCPLVMRQCISHDMHISGLWHLISTDPESAWDRDSFRGAVRGRGSGSRLRLIVLHLPWQEFPIACLSFCAVACAPPS